MLGRVPCMGAPFLAILGLTARGCTGFLAMLGLNSFLAFFVNLSNFLVTKHTSALTLQVRATPPPYPTLRPSFPSKRALSTSEDLAHPKNLRGLVTPAGGARAWDLSNWRGRSVACSSSRRIEEGRMATISSF